MIIFRFLVIIITINTHVRTMMDQNNIYAIYQVPSISFQTFSRFKEGRESVRDDERCGRSKEVNTPELIGQIKNFMDKNRRVSIETISAV